LSSAISAKKGIQSVDVGSESSEACELLVGIDGFLKKLIDKLNAEIDLAWGNLRLLEAGLAEMKEESERLETDIGNLAQEEDQIRLKAAQMQEKIRAMADSGETDGPLLQKVVDLNRMLEQKLELTSRNTEEKFNRQEELEESIKHRKIEIRKAVEHMNALKERIEKENEMSETDKGSPAVKVTGVIYSGTVIRGPKSIIKLKDNYRNVTLKERKTDREDARLKWSMEIVRHH
jgi:hypothetical protein